MDDVFKALAGAERRKLLDTLRTENGQTLGELCRHLDMTRQAVTKHLAILETANLVAVVWRCREKCTTSIQCRFTRSRTVGLKWLAGNHGWSQDASRNRSPARHHLELRGVKLVHVYVNLHRDHAGKGGEALAGAEFTRRGDLFLFGPRRFLAGFRDGQEFAIPWACLMPLASEM